jgi:RNA polymerase primary sigma factor
VPAPKHAAKPVAKAAAPAPAKPLKGGKPEVVADPKGAHAAKGAPAAKQAAAPAAPVAAPGKPGRKRRGEGSADAEALSAIERRAPVMPEERQSQLKLLIALGKEQSFLTYSQVNDHLPSEIVDPEQIEDIVNMINDMGIPVYEKAPDSEPLLATENSQPADDEAIEEAAAALAALDAELGRTTDPVRMYMREMGTVELFTREGEISTLLTEEGLTPCAAPPPTRPPLNTCSTSTRRAARGRWSTSSSVIDLRRRDRAAAEPDQDGVVEAADAEKEDEEEAEDGETEESVDTVPDPEEAARRFAR